MENRRIRIVSEFLYFLLTGRHQRIFSTRWPPVGHEEHRRAEQRTRENSTGMYTIWYDNIFSQTDLLHQVVLIGP
jgi:hypothetical protein